LSALGLEAQTFCTKKPQRVDILPRPHAPLGTITIDDDDDGSEQVGPMLIKYWTGNRAI